MLEHSSVAITRLEIILGVGERGKTYVENNQGVPYVAKNNSASNSEKTRLINFKEMECAIHH